MTNVLVRERIRRVFARNQQRGPTIAAVVAFLVVLADAVARLWVIRRAFAGRKCLSLSTPLQGACWKLATPVRKYDDAQWFYSSMARFFIRVYSCLSHLPFLGGMPSDHWRGFCPSCKRPIEAALSYSWGERNRLSTPKDKFAFVINLWGSSPEYVLGALVLGHSIRRTGTKHSLVCLHTSDVPEGFINLLSRVWDCRVVEHVKAATESMSTVDKDDSAHRFAKVFTKLRGMALVEFAKVLVMDIDLLVMSNIDEVFDLPAPAATKRGMNEGWYALKNGSPIDGRIFWMGGDGSKWAWKQGAGINAGVMLWQPDAHVLKDMLAEVVEPNHPEHIAGNGPEQDYLSRYWADAPWTHIGVEYNYQLHQMFFGLHPVHSQAERTRVLHTPEKIKIVHFSGEPTAKPWCRVLDEQFADIWPDRSQDAAYVRTFAQEFQGYYLWVLRDPEAWAQVRGTIRGWELEGMDLGTDGQIYQTVEGSADPEAKELVEVPHTLISGAMTLIESALGKWFDSLEELQQDFNMDLPQTLKDMKRQQEEQKAQEAALRSSAATPAVSSTSSKTALAADTADALQWERRLGCWHSERIESGAGGTCQKLSVACGAVAGSHFVTFIEDGTETFGDRGSEDECFGVYVKVVGPNRERHFRFDASAEEQSKNAESLASLNFWVRGVPPGAVVLLAIVGVTDPYLEMILHALAPLGVPETLPPATVSKVLAAVGKDSRTTNGGSSARWNCVHASRDVAYAATSFSDA